MFIDVICFLNHCKIKETYSCIIFTNYSVIQLIAKPSVLL